jgi:methylated-DNA-[protein]-cysteine S-methyltransferase
MSTQSEASSPKRYCVFATAIGHCGIAWSAHGVTRLQLPEADRAASEKRLAARTSGLRTDDPPEPIVKAIGEIQRYSRGARVDFSPVVLDLSAVDEFCCSVYAATRTLGWGQTATYGEIARRIGMPDPRDVGQALSRNPIPLIIPCHRVLASGGKLGGFSAYGGTLTKERLLSLEGVGADAPRLPGL